MAFGSTSSVFGAFITDSLNNTAALDLNSDSLKVALFGNSVTPDKNATAANSAYNAGTWLLANEVSDSGGWASGGRSLASVTSAFSSGTYTFDAADIVSGTITSGISNAYGVLIYDDTLTTPVADQGVCFLAFGGAVSAPSGTLTVVFNASGIFTIAY